MSTPMSCPNNCDLTGDPIPDEHRDYYQEGSTHFSRAIGIYDWYKDRTVFWSCPDCKVTWDRFTKEIIEDEEEGRILPGLVELFERPSPFSEGDK
jgi:hypothetical protein